MIFISFLKILKALTWLSKNFTRQVLIMITVISCVESDPFPVVIFLLATCNICLKFCDKKIHLSIQDTVALCKISWLTAKNFLSLNWCVFYNCFRMVDKSSHSNVFTTMANSLELEYHQKKDLKTPVNNSFTVVISTFSHINEHGEIISLLSILIM